LLGGIVRDRVLLAVTLGSEAARRNAPADQFSHDSVRSIPRKLEIPVSATNIIGIATNLHADVWISRQNRRNIV
jgi:hypothetical protein